MDAPRLCLPEPVRIRRSLYWPDPPLLMYGSISNWNKIDQVIALISKNHSKLAMSTCKLLEEIATVSEESLQLGEFNLVSLLKKKLIMTSIPIFVHGYLTSMCSTKKLCHI
uniref:Uncharacterized protein n=1 Tax=Micrurus spixii TaxID=129469 RepID=A0A2D4NIH9_9SAUR